MKTWLLEKFVYPIVRFFFPHGAQGENDPEGWKNKK